MNTNYQQLAALQTIFDEAEQQGILLWLESGWAIDARLGIITREHGDIDIAFSSDKETAYQELLQALGFNKTEIMDYGFLSWKQQVLLDSEPCFWKNGEYGFADFPNGSCPMEKEGIIEGYRVRCVSWEAMYFEFLGYADEIPSTHWREKDRKSLQIIEAHVSDERKQALQMMFAKTQNR